MTDYDILGICKDDSLQDLKTAYKRKALLLHPDKNHHPKANEKFIQLDDAYKRLLLNAINHTTNDTQHKSKKTKPESKTESKTESKSYDLFVTHEDLWNGKKIGARLPNGDIVDIDIPPGSHENSKFASNNMNFQIKVCNSTTFKREGFTLHYREKISIFDCLRSDLELKIPSLDRTKKIWIFDVPPIFSLQKGILIIKNYGLPNKRKIRSHLIVHFEIQYPKTTLSQKHCDYLNEIARDLM